MSLFSRTGKHPFLGVYAAERADLSLVWLDSNETTCWALIGEGGARMCVAEKAVGEVKCPVHLGGRKVRFFLEKTAYFIPAVKSQACFTVFCEPCLLKFEIPADILLEIQGGVNTMRG